MTIIIGILFGPFKISNTEDLREAAKKISGPHEPTARISSLPRF
jgi:hypothetical protein